MSLARRLGGTILVLLLLGLGGATLNQGRVLLFLEPRAQRPLSADQSAAVLRRQLERIPGLRVFISNPPPISIGGLNTRSQYQFTLQDTDTEELYKYAGILQDKVRQLPGFEDVSTDMQVRNPQVTLVQSMLLPPAPVNVGPGTVRFTRNDPSDPIVAWASPAFDDPGKATKAWYPWLLRDCSSGT